jgi:hypothetical protein
VVLISRFRIAVPALLLLAASAFAADDIKPEAILDKFVEVTGGRAAYEKVKSEIATATLEITGVGARGRVTSYSAAPAKSYTVIDFAGMGKAEQGSNGEVAWSIDAGEGPRIKQGDERALALRSGVMHMEIRWRDSKSRYSRSRGNHRHDLPFSHRLPGHSAAGRACLFGRRHQARGHSGQVHRSHRRPRRL